MPFDVDSVTFHLAKFESEIVVSMNKLTPIQYSALVGTIGGFIVNKKETFMDSKRAAWEIKEMIKDLASGNFPPIEKEETHDERIEDRIPA